MRRFALSCLLLAALSMSGCFYSNIRIPFDTDLSETKLGDKVGEAHYQSVLGLVAWGDASTQAAAEQGNIDTIRHMDQEIFLILWPIYGCHTTIVYGD